MKQAIMRSVVMVCLWCGCTAPAAANTQLGSETAHIVGGALLGAGATWVADHYRPQQRLLIGFLAVATIAIAEELRQKASATSNHVSTLDITATALGGAVGAALTDRYLLRPVISKHDGKLAYGLRFGAAF
jgi:hypothetical protein